MKNIFCWFFLENNHKIMCSLWIVYYKHKFFFSLAVFYLFWLNYIKYQLRVCYLKRCLCTQKYYLFIVTSFLKLFLIVLFLCLLKIVWNCILLPKGINEFVVFLCIVACIVLNFYPFTQISIIGHKGTIFFPEQKFCFRMHFLFSYKNVASKSF